MNAPPPRIPPRQVPVLTEVIDLDFDGLEADGTIAAGIAPQPAFTPPLEPAPVFVAEVPPALSALLEQGPTPIGPDEATLAQEPAAPQPAAAAAFVPSADLQPAAAAWQEAEAVAAAGQPVADQPWAGPAVIDQPVIDQPVIDQPVMDQPVPALQPDALAAAHPAPTADAGDDQLTQRVLHEVQRHIDLMLEYRLRQMLGPILARAADGIVKDARQDLAATLRDVVARAVAQELARQRGR